MTNVGNSSYVGALVAGWRRRPTINDTPRASRSISIIDVLSGVWEAPSVFRGPLQGYYWGCLLCEVCIDIEMGCWYRIDNVLVKQEEIENNNQEYM